MPFVFCIQNDFVCVWEIERRLEPFGRVRWEDLSEEMLGGWEGSFAKKTDLLHRVAVDLGDPLGAPSLLAKGQVSK